MSTSRALAENFCNREGGSVKEQRIMTKIQCDNARCWEKLLRLGTFTNNPPLIRDCETPTELF